MDRSDQGGNGPGGEASIDVTALLRRRADIRDRRRLAAGEERAHLRSADRELREQLRAALAPDRLRLRWLTADDPDAVLEQVVRHEQVHPIPDRRRLLRRLAPDRRVAALVHEDAADELLVFVEVALVSGLATAIPPLLEGPVAPHADESADAAAFYSINNCQPGAAGLNLGRELLVRAVPALAAQLPHLGLFATLSPMPGFRRWAGDERGADDVPAVLAAAARYLTETDSGRVVDPVGNFHLSNGARVEQVNWGADPSPQGQAQSWGVMVNYRYDPALLDDRAAAYRAGEVSRSPAVDELLRA